MLGSSLVYRNINAQVYRENIDKEAFNLSVVLNAIVYLAHLTQDVPHVKFVFPYVSSDTSGGLRPTEDLRYVGGHDERDGLDITSQVREGSARIRIRVRDGTRVWERIWMRGSR